MADNVLAQVPRKRYPTLDEQMRSDIVNYLSRLKSDFVTSGERAGQGLGQVIDDGNYLEGVPRVVLGGLGALSAPVSAAVSPVLGPLLQPVGEAVDTYVGQPVERATGYPADITNELFLTGVTAGAGPLLKPALKGTGNFLATMGDAAEAGLNRVGYTARPQEGVRFTFGGPMALTADKAKLAQAQKMAADGLSRDEIWKQTGWFQGVDGKWRFEIDDSNFNLRQNILEQHQNSRIGSTLTVGLTDAIDAPDLLSAYNLGDTTLDLSRLSKGGIGGFDRAKNSIELMAAPDADIMRRGLLHEVQHLIQQKEGFTGGGDPSKLGADKYKRLGGEVEARNVEARRNFTPAQRSAITPWATQDVPFEGQHLATAQQGLQRSGFGSVKLADDVAEGGGLLQQSADVGSGVGLRPNAGEAIDATNSVFRAHPADSQVTGNMRLSPKLSSVDNLKEMLDDLGFKVEAHERSTSNTETFGPSASQYLMVVAPNGKRMKVRLSDHDYLAPDGGVDLRYSNTPEIAQEQLLLAAGMDVPDGVRQAAEAARNADTAAKQAANAAKVAAENEKKLPRIQKALDRAENSIGKNELDRLVTLARSSNPGANAARKQLQQFGLFQSEFSLIDMLPSKN